MWIYLPGLGSTDGEGTTGRVVFGLGLHTAGIAAVVGLCQAKAAQDFSPSCTTNANMNDNLESVLLNVVYKCGKMSLSPSRGKYFSFWASVPYALIGCMTSEDWTLMTDR